ncbi:MAG: Cof-type HAD-IIB family hydrolase [Eubacteriales bacterium]|jgi:Cof subfamily protein (haloacid dehalogenase superfamily)|nr:Cof-type HAD-IIB family hydrolase [Eubacteriales bacterium]
MGAFDGYYLYCDLDGTLFDDEKRVSAKNRAAIESFVSQGGRFGVATGRAPSIIGTIERDLPVNAPCILLNGAGLYDLAEKRFLAMHPLDQSLIGQVASCVTAAKHNACVQVFTVNSIYETNPAQRDDPQTVRERLPVTSAPLEQIGETTLKLLIAHTSENLDAIHVAVQQEPYIDMFSVFRTADWYLEFVAAGVNKGAALEDVRARCGNVKKILAIGDYNNDLEMVAFADIGGAPANAIDEVKAAADIVLTASNNESCVARFLESALG